MPQKTLSLRYPSVNAPVKTLVLDKVWYTQKRPYRSPLGYTVDRQYADGYYRDAASVPPARYSVPLLAEVANDLYGKFQARLGERAENLVNLAEYNQARSMIIKRSLQLGRFVKRLKKLDFIGAGNELGLQVDYRQRRKQTGAYFRPRNLRRDTRSMASNFLEYRFGWAPLINDIHTSAQILTNGIPATKVRATASLPFRQVYQYDGSMYSILTITTTGYRRMMHGADVSVDNPNLWLANQLGLVNPLGVAWELVPFSFLVDWFVNVGQVLSSISDTAGLSLTNEYTSTRTSYKVLNAQVARPGAHPGNNQVYEYGGDSFVRTLGSLDKPTLRWSHVRGLSVGQGASAIALILQQLPNRASLWR